MTSFFSKLPLADLRDVRPDSLLKDATSAVGITVLGIPQGIAYAMIAGLPPAMGLYASIVPTAVGSLFRSSRHVITGPTNALSLLVGAAMVATSHDPATAAVTLALLTGLLQAAAGMLRLGALVDYISSPVVLGYITGAGVLIGVGQLHNITLTTGPRGTLFESMTGWVAALSGGVHPLSVAMAVATIATMVAVRSVGRKLPDAVIAMGLAIMATAIFRLDERGLRTIEDIAPIQAGLPPISMPDASLFIELLPIAVACTVLSLVESSAVARSIAARTGQRLNASAEFTGQGLANIAAAFFSGYPTSGSLSRSAINEQSGATSRMSGFFSALMTLMVLMIVGPLLNITPIAALAGLLLVVAKDLVKVRRIRKVMRTRRADQAAFLVTLVGTWMLDLDKAIYVGVGISLVLFLQRARLLLVREMAFDQNNQLRERRVDLDSGVLNACRKVRLLHVEGALFFGSSGELRDALEQAAASPGVEVVLVRLKRTQGMDLTTIEALEAVAVAMRSRDQRLVVVSLSPEPLARLARTGAMTVLGTENVYPTKPGWFHAMDAALTDIHQRLSPCEGGCPDCPLTAYTSRPPKPR